MSTMTEQEAAAHRQHIRWLEGDERPTALKISDALRAFVDRTGSLASWLFVPLIVVTVFDVTARKLVWIQIWLVENFGRIFESTLLQELEWHFHTALFTLVLGYGFIYNSHVRVDLVRENLDFRKKVRPMSSSHAFLRNDRFSRTRSTRT